MPKITTIKEYLNEEELLNRYRQAENPAERSHWQIIWLLATKERVNQVAQVTGYTPGWIRELARRYNKLGPEGLVDRRQSIPGAKPLLDKSLQAELDQVLQQPPPDGGLWSGPKVAEWIATKLGRKVHRQRGWEWLERMDYTLQQPRPHHASSSAEAVEEFKKNSQVK